MSLLFLEPDGRLPVPQAKQQHCIHNTQYFLIRNLSVIISHFCLEPDGRPIMPVDCTTSSASSIPEDSIDHENQANSSGN